MAMTYVFRTDASRSIGTGHVIRCLTLAKALREENNKILFICREHEGHLCDHIKEQGFEVHRLPAPRENFSAKADPAHASWLGAPFQEDADETSAVIRTLGIKPDWLVIDHYGIDLSWEKNLRPLVNHIFVIDDLADRNHDCDILLDQNLVPHLESRYNGRISEDCTQLFGPKYALLQPTYADLHHHIPPRKGPIRRILISFGGSDIDNLTGQVLEAFISLNRPDIEVDVVISNGSSYASSLQEMVSGYPNIHLHNGLPILAPLMVKSDFAIGAAGTTSWERLCLGLPALVITMADNQRPIAKELQHEGLIRWLGHKDKITVEKIRDCLDELIEKGIDEEWSTGCRTIVDGKGVNCIIAVLITTHDTPLSVRRASLSDEALVLAWANNPETRRNSFSPAPISSEIHKVWFLSKLRDIEGCIFFIVETPNKIPMGQVRFERMDQAWEIHYVIAPEFRGRGLGKSLLKRAMLALKEEHPGVLVVGRVKSKNLRSKKIFEGLGFDYVQGAYQHQL